MYTLIKNATIINEGNVFEGGVSIKDDLIHEIYREGDDLPEADKVIDAKGCYLVPGAIDDQVHFREPGLTHKADIQTESAAAVAGGITSYMEMPNTNPQTTNIDALLKKFETASSASYANYSFYLGATNNNLDELLKADSRNVCGIKIFMGSSTGNMLVDKKESLENIFREVPLLIATHCEDEATIQANTDFYHTKYGEDLPFRFHPLIRNAEACYKSSSFAIELAEKHNARLHVLHISTGKELSLFKNKIAIDEKKITGEVCVHHLWFTDKDYNNYGSRIKWNPAVKTSEDREALRAGLKSNLLDVVATDHAPHTLEEKNNTYFKAPSGGPLVEHALIAMLEMTVQNIFSKEMVIEKMCHSPARLFRIEKRGFIRKGYYADLVLIAPDEKNTIDDSSVYYKCKWSPFAGTTFSHRITHTFVNGQLVFEKGNLISKKQGKALVFNR